MNVAAPDITVSVHLRDAEETHDDSRLSLSEAIFRRLKKM